MYALKAEGNANGSNIDIVAYSSKDSAQLFRFTKNLDGSYSILSHASKDARLVEAAGASKDNGANIQQWEPTNSSCQKWNIITETTTTTATTTSTTTTTTTTSTTTTTTTTVPPTTVTQQIEGDVNDDKQFNISDLVLVQNWILGKPDVKLANWQAGDLSGNGEIDIFDVVLMRKKLV